MKYFVWASVMLLSLVFPSVGIQSAEAAEPKNDVPFIGSGAEDYIYDLFCGSSKCEGQKINEFSDSQINDTFFEGLSKTQVRKIRSIINSICENSQLTMTCRQLETGANFSKRIRVANEVSPDWACSVHTGAVSYTHLTLPTICSV